MWTQVKQKKKTREVNPSTGSLKIRTFFMHIHGKFHGNLRMTFPDDLLWIKVLFQGKLDLAAAPTWLVVLIWEWKISLTIFMVVSPVFVRKSRSGLKRRTDKTEQCGPGAGKTKNSQEKKRGNRCEEALRLKITHRGTKAQTWRGKDTKQDY